MKDIIFNYLQEATTEYKEKINDPALMTWDEYIKFNNEYNKYHDKSAYETSYESEKNDHIRKAKYKTLLNNLKVNGLSFEFRLRKERVQYVKSLNGEPLRDDKGNVLYYSDEEREAVGKTNFIYSLAIFDEYDATVAFAGDEWGATLISVVQEYRGYGFAKILKDKWSELYPDMRSGGLTPQGYGFNKSYHAKKVREYLAKGFYSFLIRSKQITKERVKSIIDSIQPKNKTRTEHVNLDFTKPDDILVMQVGNNPEFIIYNKRGYDFYQTELEDKYSTHIDRLIKGHIRLMYMSEDDSYRLHLNYYENYEYKELLKNLVLSYLKENNELLFLTKQTREGLEMENIKVVGKTQFYSGWDIGESINNPIDYKSLVRKEKRYRATKDKYNEYYNRITEHAYQLSEDTAQKNESILISNNQFRLLLESNENLIDKINTYLNVEPYLKIGSSAYGIDGNILIRVSDHKPSTKAMINRKEQFYNNSNNNNIKYYFVIVTDDNIDEDLLEDSILEDFEFYFDDLNIEVAVTVLPTDLSFDDSKLIIDRDLRLLKL